MSNSAGYTGRQGIRARNKKAPKEGIPRVILEHRQERMLEYSLHLVFDALNKQLWSPEMVESNTGTNVCTHHTTQTHTHQVTGGSVKSAGDPLNDSYVLEDGTSQAIHLQLCIYP